MEVIEVVRIKDVIIEKVSANDEELDISLDAQSDKQET